MKKIDATTIRVGIRNKEKSVIRKILKLHGGNKVSVSRQIDEQIVKQIAVDESQSKEHSGGKSSPPKSEELQISKKRR